ncbi:MAG: toll/interleukin-1 receptor domain-containing protein [Gammaproteobacteria bacterium]|nr:toll/interleukin-1 receptor domain-containing protein [Gammaproteobacteria bacterium]
MAGIFINYRREDAAADAGRLFDDLRRRCKDEHVFMDLTIEAGKDFRAALSEKLETCDVLLALMGPRWLHVKNEATGRRRLDEEQDFVRLEIATALVQQKIVIPVILPGAKMPSAESLPESIRELAWRNAFELQYKHWASGVNELVQQFPGTWGGCEDTLTALPWISWPHMLALSISLLTATHVFAVFTLPLDPLFLIIGLSLLLGIVQARLFHFKISQQLLLGLVVSVVTGVLTSIFVPILSEQSIIPESWVEVRLFATFVAGIFAGYLIGTMIVHVIFSRGRSFMGGHLNK